MIQDIIDTGLPQWGASKEEAKVILGGGSTMDTKVDWGVHLPPKWASSSTRQYMQRPNEVLGA